MEGLEKIFDFLQTIERLKSTLRYNWCSSGRQESTAEHSWRLALLTFLVAEQLKLDINPSHSVKLALIHDIVEAIAGDTNYVDIHNGKISRQEKRQKELEAIECLKQQLPEHLGNQIHDLWHEYEDCVTREAKFVRALDKLETTTQLLEGGHKNFDDGYAGIIPNYPDKAVNDFPELKPMLVVLKQRLKKEFIKGGYGWKPEYD